MSLAATYVDQDTFTVVTNLTSIFMAGRRVRASCGNDGYKYGTILSSSYINPNTTVNLTASSDNLTPNLTAVEYGIIGEGSNQSLPEHDHSGDEGDGGLVTVVSVHATSHEVGGGDLVDHDSLTGFVADEHVILPNTIVNVLSDHDKAAHDALALSHDSLSDVSVDDHHAQVHATEHEVGGSDLVNHDSLTGFVADEHVSLPSTIAAVLTDHDKAAHDTLALSHDSLSDVSPDDHHDEFHDATSHTDITSTGAEIDDAVLKKHDQIHATEHEVGGTDLVSHDSLTDFVAAEHVSLPNTIVNVLSDHDKAAHDTLALSHDSLSDVSPDDHHDEFHDATSHTDITSTGTEIDDAVLKKHDQIHASSHNLTGVDELNHDNLAGFVAAEHVSLPNTIANVLSDHDKAAHDTLALSHDSLSDVSVDDHHAQDHLHDGDILELYGIDSTGGTFDFQTTGYVQFYDSLRVLASASVPTSGMGGEFVFWAPTSTGYIYACNRDVPVHYLPFNIRGNPLKLYKGGALDTTEREYLGLYDDEIVVNEPGNDIDFRVESDNDDHALFVQGSNGYVGVLTAVPSEALDVTGNIAVSGTVDGVDVASHASRHNSAEADELNHDNLAGFVEAEHVSLPNTIANVLSDHSKVAHDALALSHDSLADVSTSDHHAKYLDAEAVAAVEAAGLTLASAKVIDSADENLLFKFGRAYVGHMGTNDIAAFGHRDRANASDYGYAQAASGTINLNAPTGENINFRINAALQAYMNASGLTLHVISAEGTDVDKFLVSNAGLVKYRTGAQVLSDIGAVATATFNDHSARHLVGGADTIFPVDPEADRYLMWDDDPGELVWAEVSAGAHAASHENGGGDEISVAALSGLLADDQHVLDAEVVSAIEAAGFTLASTKVIDSADEDLLFTLGRASIGKISVGGVDYAGFGHRDHFSNVGYAVLQEPLGGTNINAIAGQVVKIKINGVTRTYVGPTTTNLYSGQDLVAYSDAGVTEKARIDGATGNITTVGTVDGTDIAAFKTSFDDHSARHESGGADSIKLDDLATPDDNVDLNVSATAHGLAPKHPNDTDKALRGDGTWTKVYATYKA